MTPTEEHLVRSLVDLAIHKARGRLILGEADCKTLAWLYQADPGYVRWDGSAGLVCTMYQLLSDPHAVGRRRRLLASVKKAAAGETTLLCNRTMAGHLLCLFDREARSQAESSETRQQT